MCIENYMYVHCKYILVCTNTKVYLRFGYSFTGILYFLSKIGYFEKNLRKQKYCGEYKSLFQPCKYI